ncbi:MAG: Fe-S cluster assembly ATPase SufC [Alphaproteobacteria bacterium]
MLEIKDLHVSAGGQEILRGINLVVNAGEVHAIMGPNGSGKSTLSYILAGRPGYEITKGGVRYFGEDLTVLAPEVRAARGIFLGFQYPVEIPGVATMTFLKHAINAQRKSRGEEELDAMGVMKLVQREAGKLKISADMLKRPVNAGFSGGEKKRCEILQMAVLQPLLAVLDETDSGLDVDALRLVGDGITGLRAPDRAMLVITHYQRLLDHIIPDFVHVLADGKIQRSGGKDLALELDRDGYGGALEPARATAKA